MASYFLGSRALSMITVAWKDRDHNHKLPSSYYCPWASYCWAWQLAVWNIYLGSLVKLSQLSSLINSCPPQAYLFWQNVMCRKKALVLCIAEQKMNDCCVSHEHKSEHRKGCYEESSFHPDAVQNLICYLQVWGKRKILYFLHLPKFYHVAQRENYETKSRVNLKIIVHQEKVDRSTQVFFLSKGFMETRKEPEVTEGGKHNNHIWSGHRDNIIRSYCLNDLNFYLLFKLEDRNNRTRTTGKKIYVCVSVCLCVYTLLTIILNLHY